MRVCNLFAGPGTGKSTTAGALFAILKYAGVNCEYVQEFAKDSAWEGRSKKFFRAQQYIYGEQSWRLERVRDEVDIIVTDCPLLMGLVYMPKDFPMTSLRNTIIEDHERYTSLNAFLVRNKPFNPKGRNQDESEARELDIQIKSMLSSHKINHLHLEFGRDNPAQLVTAMIDLGWGDAVPALYNVA